MDKFWHTLLKEEHVTASGQKIKPMHEVTFIGITELSVEVHVGDKRYRIVNPDFGKGLHLEETRVHA